MKIESFIGNSDNLEALQQMKILLSQEIYRHCLLANIDPDLFEYKKFILEHKNNLNSMVIKYYPDLVIYCEKLDLINKKIEELNVN